MSAPLNEEPPKKPLPAYDAEGKDAFDWEAEQGASKPTRWRFPQCTIGLGTSPIASRFDRLFPPDKRYFGRFSRRTFVLCIVGLLLAIVALVVGLSVGLTKKSSKSRNLPLPNGAETFTGDLTYYEPGLGACGITSTSKENIVAISHFTFDAVQTGSDPNQNPLCGRKLRAQREYNGEMVSVDLTVVDRCTGCQPTDIDVSIAVFDKLAHRDIGRVPVAWAWL